MAAAPGDFPALDASSVTEVVQYVRVPDDELGTRLVTHDDVARVVLTGSIETAQLFARWKPSRPVLAETSGKNALVVTPSADLDLAVADLVRSAFGHAGQKCSAASLAILVGSAGDPRTETGGACGASSWTRCARSPPARRPTSRRPWARSPSPRRASCCTR